jgi:hypothetical protein
MRPRDFRKRARNRESSSSSSSSSTFNDALESSSSIQGGYGLRRRSFLRFDRDIELQRTRSSDERERVMKRVNTGNDDRNNGSNSNSSVGIGRLVFGSAMIGSQGVGNIKAVLAGEGNCFDTTSSSSSDGTREEDERYNTTAQPTCRFCLEEETKELKLISPCDCKGSQQFVHSKCLERWQMLSLKSGLDRNCAICSVCKKKFDGPKDPVWKLVLKLAYVHLHKRRWFYGYAFFKWLKMSKDLIDCSTGITGLPLVTLVVTSLAHLVDVNMRYKRIIGLINQDAASLSILQLELSVYFNRSLFWASNDSSDLAKCVEALGFMLAWPTTALTLLSGWSIKLNGDYNGWIKAIQNFAEQSKFGGISRKTAISIALANLVVLAPASY